ncbi:MAG: aminotransferase class I/II-fold pyridoxal phosphate-dependent enzyme [Oscillatoriales cyanobacterium SM2_1_8]|nr:aminotransferase class I/II-fold pyridoxal phosphate-dependent enzyme [Oscillatoriales cyanobacterium SM2_1_8]
MHKLPFEGSVVQAARLAGCLPEEILDCAININPLGIPPALRRLWRPAEAWRLLQGVQRYPDPEYGVLRQAFAEAVGVSAVGVVPGNGSAELLELAAQETVALGAEQVITLAPHGPGLTRALQRVGRSPVYVPALWSEEETVLGKAIEAVGDRPFALWASNPHNPTGQLYQPEFWRQILAMPHCTMLLVDES